MLSTISAFGTVARKRAVVAQIYSLDLNGSGYAEDTSISGIASGEYDCAWEGWLIVETAPASGELQGICFLGNNSVARDGFGLCYRNTAGTMQLEIRVPVNDKTINTTFVVDTKYWVCVNYDSATNTFEAFVNNSSIGTTSALGGNLSLNPAKVRIGAIIDSASLAFKGKLIDWRFHNAKLGTTERATRYNSGTIAISTSLGTEELLYKFQNNYTDDSGNGNTLTAGGSGNTFVLINP